MSELERILTYLTPLVLAIVAYLNWKSSSLRNKVLDTVDNSNALKALNESVDLANARALKAETSNTELRLKVDKLELSNSELVEKMDARDAESYHIAFDVILGNNPKIQVAEIKRFIERRYADGNSYGSEDRRK